MAKHINVNLEPIYYSVVSIVIVNKHHSHIISYAWISYGWFSRDFYIIPIIRYCYIQAQHNIIYERESFCEHQFMLQKSPSLEWSNYCSIDIVLLSGVIYVWPKCVINFLILFLNFCVVLHWVLRVAAYREAHLITNLLWKRLKSL